MTKLFLEFQLNAADCWDMQEVMWAINVEMWKCGRSCRPLHENMNYRRCGEPMKINVTMTMGQKAVNIKASQDDCCQFIFGLLLKFHFRNWQRGSKWKNASIPFVKAKPTFNESCVSRAEKTSFLLSDCFADNQTLFCKILLVTNRQELFVWQNISTA